MNDTVAAPAVAAPSGRFASRKFLITMLVLIAAGAADALHIAIDPNVVDLVKWIVGLYFTGNVAAAGVSLLKSKAAAQ